MKYIFYTALHTMFFQFSSTFSPRSIILEKRSYPEPCLPEPIGVCRQLFPKGPTVNGLTTLNIPSETGSLFTKLAQVFKVKTIGYILIQAF